MTTKLGRAVIEARKKFHKERGRCSICAIGDRPVNGLHHGQHPCGNNETCSLCHNTDMKYDDQCAACGRIEKSDGFN